LQGRVLDSAGQPIAGAWVLISLWDGTTYRAQSDAQGQYALLNVPAGLHDPVATASDYATIEVAPSWQTVRILPGESTNLNITLPLPERPAYAPGRNLQLGPAVERRCDRPLESTALRQTITFDSGGQSNQPTFLYYPSDLPPDTRLPTLIAIYPGPSESWECVSLPLSAAGYAVLAVGPAYSFNLERDIDEIARLVDFVRAGQLAPAEGPIALLGGSYSTLHLQRLLQRTAPPAEGFTAAVLLGPPTDLFEMRRLLEEGSFIPPFGLDQAMVAIGLPSENPLNYLTYSGGYHLPPHLPPILLMHSLGDDVVPYQQSEFLAEQLEAAGLPHETHFFEGASHYLLSDAAEAVQMYTWTLDFLAEHLQQ
jgi:acetyl esterase/lipase